LVLYGAADAGVSVAPDAKLRVAPIARVAMASARKTGPQKQK